MQRSAQKLFIGVGGASPSLSHGMRIPCVEAGSLAAGWFLSATGAPHFFHFSRKKCVFNQNWYLNAPFGSATCRTCHNFCFVVLCCSTAFQRVCNRIICASLPIRMEMSCFCHFCGKLARFLQNRGPPSIGFYWKSIDFYCFPIDSYRKSVDFQ